MDDGKHHPADEIWAEFRVRQKRPRPACLFCEALHLTGRHDPGCIAWRRRR